MDSVRCVCGHVYNSHLHSVPARRSAWGWIRSPARLGECTTCEDCGRFRSFSVGGVYWDGPLARGVTIDDDGLLVGDRGEDA